MTTVYRAYSPSRATAHGITTNRDHATGTASALNQNAATETRPADWTVQEGTATWET